MPRKAAALRPVKCAECGKSFETTRRAKFCSEKHRRDYGKRNEARGQVLAPYVLAWLAGRGGGNTPAHVSAGQCMREITSIGRIFIAEDKAAGRDPIAYAEGLLLDGLYIDRMRRPTS